MKAKLELRGEKLFDKKGKQNDGDSNPSHDQVRYSILTVLYKKAETSPNNCEVNREKIIELLNVPEETIDFNIKYLVEEKLIKTETTMESWVWAEITSDGFKVIEHKEENKNRFPFLNATIPVQIQTKIGIINF